MQNFSPNNFEDVFSAELDEVAKRQEKPSGAEVDRKELTGLALSGGGIRSATSSLGVLQALKNLGLLGTFDYLSTVSGGGFTGGWWSAWTSRNFDKAASRDDKFFPPCEQIQPERDAFQATQLQDSSTKKNSTPPEDDIESRRKASDPVHHLRLFSNYLTPVKGFLSADTWRVNAVISRNLALTWLVLVPMLFAAVLLAQSYFTIQPGSETEFLYPYSYMNTGSIARNDSITSHWLNTATMLAKHLDSAVDNSAAIALSPGNGLRKLVGQPPKSDANNSIKEASRNQLFNDSGGMESVQFGISNDIETIQQLDAMAEMIALEVIGDTGVYRVIEGKLAQIEQGFIDWSNRVSAIYANTFSALPAAHAAKPLNRQKELDMASDEFQNSAGPVIDSVLVCITELKQEVLSRRQQMREGLLFKDAHLSYLAERVVWASYIPIVMLGWVVMLICLWMINSSNKMFGGNILQATYAFICGLIGFNFLYWLVPHILGIVEPDNWSLTGSSSLIQLVWSVGALALLNIILWDDAHSFWKTHRKSLGGGGIAGDAMQQLVKLLEVRRSRIVTYHQRLLLGAFLISILLCFGGFGHEAINYLLFYSSGNTFDFGLWISRLAGVAVIFSALAGTGFAARIATSASATTGRGNPKPPSKIKSLAIAMAPPLILLLLLCGISWTSHWILQALVFRTGRNMDENYTFLIFAMWVLGFLSLYYAVHDIHFRPRRAKSAAAHARQEKEFSRLLFAVVLIVQIVMMLTVFVYPTDHFPLGAVWVALPIIVWSAIAWKYVWELKNPKLAGAKAVASTTPTAMDKIASKYSKIIRGVSLAGFSSIVILVFSATMIFLISDVIGVVELPIDHLFLGTLCASLFILILDLIWGIRSPEDGLRGNHESRLLLAINVTLFTLFLIFPPLSIDAHWGVTHVLEVLISIAIGLVIFVGWRVDPNALSIHAFYRNRIVRAYLGASNWFRGRSSVSDVHPEDDIALTNLTNCEQGAPYHLVNTTLNLLGTKSLEAAQRHASNFILSKRYCGSVTTGYRPTDEYMSGTMTLGTAVAVSGAAASPNMGSNQVSGATTMLMSLLNIRLGYWAANPGRSRWRESQPKLWPYYLLKESLSQTSGFGTFCYLTDGGHFDNTGLYPLIERGCRYIVLCDNGADPDSHFKDLGNALRRCRIDFGVEFSLDGLKGMTSLGGSSTARDAHEMGKAHWLRGTVKYSEEHLRRLWGDKWDDGLSHEEREKFRTGAILVLKPILLGDEPADVLQYGLEFADFPQQSTANQWFTEGQFESYRRLGYWSAQSAFASSDYTNASRDEMLKAIAEGARG